MTKKTKGLGDTIEKITKATGIKKAIDKVAKITGVDCGCEKRKEKLNKLFPYIKTTTMTKEEVKVYTRIKELIKKQGNKIKAEQQDALLILYNDIFKKQNKRTNCTSCIQEILTQLDKLYKAQCNEIND
jgi:DNA polymerase II small subunit/DNA polymerase delta subunit B